ncbi:MAG: FKBP-type peptidyl-prolyl cis-trans isomerase [Bacteroidota bacterium]
MKIFIPLFILFLSIGLFQACETGGSGTTPNTSNVQLTSIEDSVIYGMGVYNVDALKNQFKIENPNLSTIYKGMTDASAEEAMLTPDEFNLIAQQYFREQVMDTTNTTSIAPSADGALNSIVDTMLYGMGVFSVNALVNQLKIEEPSLAALYKGMEDAMKDAASFAPEEFNRIAQTYFGRKAAEMAEENKQKGAEFLEDNSFKEGVLTTESGLQYKILTEGAGDSPQPTDVVKVHYEGKLINGEVFDSSIARGEPSQFGVTQVIPGWVEALQMMKPGSKWELYIPGNLAYGERGGPGGRIGPNETLIFEVELIEIVEQPTQ